MSLPPPTKMQDNDVFLQLMTMLQTNKQIKRIERKENKSEIAANKFVKLLDVTTKLIHVLIGDTVYKNDSNYNTKRAEKIDIIYADYQNSILPMVQHESITPSESAIISLPLDLIGHISQLLTPGEVNILQILSNSHFISVRRATNSIKLPELRCGLMPTTNHSMARFQYLQCLNIHVNLFDDGLLTGLNFPNLRTLTIMGARNPYPLWNKSENEFDVTFNKKLRSLKYTLNIKQLKYLHIKCCKMDINTFDEVFSVNSNNIKILVFNLVKEVNLYRNFREKNQNLSYDQYWNELEEIRCNCHDYHVDVNQSMLASFLNTTHIRENIKRLELSPGSLLEGITGKGMYKKLEKLHLDDLYGFIPTVNFTKQFQKLRIVKLEHIYIHDSNDEQEVIRFTIRKMITNSLVDWDVQHLQLYFHPKLMLYAMRWMIHLIHQRKNAKIFRLSMIPTAWPQTERLLSCFQGRELIKLVDKILQTKNVDVEINFIIKDSKSVNYEFINSYRGKENFFITSSIDYDSIKIEIDIKKSTKSK